MNFESWLATLLRQNEYEVQRLLKDETALFFLIAWSLFESKCCGGFVKLDKLEEFSNRIVAKESFKTDLISPATAHFHARYQDVVLYDNLMHGQPSPKLKSILQMPLDSLKPQDKVFLAALTVYRFRNNIFHGNKEIARWLNFKEQIDYCIDLMTAFVSHAESFSPSLPERLPLVA